MFQKRTGFRELFRKRNAKRELKIIVRQKANQISGKSDLCFDDYLSGNDKTSCRDVAKITANIHDT